MNFNDPLSLRKKVAKEAATLLYFGVEKEYKQAKLKAAKTSAIHFLPTNLEVAIELDKIAEENECGARHKRLIQMRKDALTLMKILEEYNPILIGSVWRGTINRESDIDIAVYHNEPNEVLKLTKQNNFKVTQTERTTVTKQGIKKASFHIYLESPTKEKAEVIVRSLEEIGHEGKCEIYGDPITGLRTQELEKVLEENPTQRFVPF